MSIWEAIKSWFGIKSNKVTLDVVLNRSSEISENDLVEILEYLTRLGYRLEKSFIGSNYLYIFDEKK